MRDLFSGLIDPPEAAAQPAARTPEEAPGGAGRVPGDTSDRGPEPVVPSASTPVTDETARTEAAAATATASPSEAEAEATSATAATATAAASSAPSASPAVPAGVITARHEKAGPKLRSALRGYSWRTFAADVTAGVTVGLVALPLAMAFAIASGLPPEAGIYCAIVTGFLISALGGSRVQIGGPTGAFVVVISGIVATYGIEGLFLCTMMAGVMLVILGATGMGTAVKFIPRPVVVGFTNGISVIIASTQIRDFLGLTVDRMPGDFIGRIGALAGSLHTVNWSAAILAAACVALMIYSLRRPWRVPVPGTILALALGTLIVAIFGTHVDTIDSRFHGIPSGLPALQMPAFRASLILTLLAPAFTVAMLGAIESLMSAVVADKLTGDRHNPNVELIAQGVANIASPLFGGLPATGAIARTATNVRSGGTTPIAGIVHALTLLAIVLVAAPMVGQVPMPVLAAILMMVAWNMGDWNELPSVFRMSRTDTSIWLVTFVLTVFANLTQAVEVGMALAALLFIRTVASTTSVAQVTEDFERRGGSESGNGRETRAGERRDSNIPPYVAVFRITGPFLFGATDKLQGIADRLDSLPPVVILRLQYMTATDATGLDAIEDLADTVRRSGRVFLVSGAQPQPSALMTRALFHRHIGERNICDSYDDALVRAREVFDSQFQPGFPKGG
jgi:sulfate permease, SulP family